MLSINTLLSYKNSWSSLKQHMLSGFFEDVCMFSLTVQNPMRRKMYFDRFSQNGQTLFSEIVVSNPQAFESRQVQNPAVAGNFRDIFNQTTAEEEARKLGRTLGHSSSNETSPIDIITLN